MAKYQRVEEVSTGVPIRRLRWPVRVCRRVQAPDPNSNQIIESYVTVAEIRADIQNVGMQTFWGNEQTESPFTHFITMRWMDWIDTTFAIQRCMIRPDTSIRTDVYRIRRLRELDGQQRFLLIEAEQEKRI